MVSPCDMYTILKNVGKMKNPEIPTIMNFFHFLSMFSFKYFLNSLIYCSRINRIFKNFEIR